MSEAFNQTLSVIGIACLPIVELKGAILWGHNSLGLPLWETYFLALLGSTLPAPFILWFLRPVLKWMKSTKLFQKIAHWLETKFKKKSRTVIKYQYKMLGLFLFVAIPLPGTGVWTGSGLAAILDLRIKYALPVIFIGNAIAGLLILVLSYGLDALIV